MSKHDFTEPLFSFARVMSQMFARTVRFIETALEVRIVYFKKTPSVDVCAGTLFQVSGDLKKCQPFDVSFFHT